LEILLFAGVHNEKYMREDVWREKFSGIHEEKSPSGFAGAFRAIENSNGNEDCSTVGPVYDGL